MTTETTNGIAQPENGIRITEEDLQELWRVNPLAQSQIINIMQGRTIRELEDRLAAAQAPKPEEIPEKV